MPPAVKTRRPAAEPADPIAELKARHARELAEAAAAWPDLVEACARGQLSADQLEQALDGDPERLRRLEADLATRREVAALAALALEAPARRAAAKASSQAINELEAERRRVEAELRAKAEYLRRGQHAAHAHAQEAAGARAKLGGLLRPEQRAQLERAEREFAQAEQELEAARRALSEAGDADEERMAARIRDAIAAAEDEAARAIVPALAARARQRVTQLRARLAELERETPAALEERLAAATKAYEAARGGPERVLGKLLL